MYVNRKLYTLDGIKTIAGIKYEYKLNEYNEYINSYLLKLYFFFTKLKRTLKLIEIVSLVL